MPVPGIVQSTDIRRNKLVSTLCINSDHDISRHTTACHYLPTQKYTQKHSVIDI
jgi:predicted transcriptional regulator YheO